MTEKLSQEPKKHIRGRGNCGQLSWTRNGKVPCYFSQPIAGAVCYGVSLYHGLIYLYGLDSFNQKFVHEWLVLFYLRSVIGYCITTVQSVNFKFFFFCSCKTCYTSAKRKKKDLFRNPVSFLRCSYDLRCGWEITKSRLCEFVNI